MPTRRALKGALRGFLGTYVSRYTDFDGYWLFGFLLSELPLEIDLLQASGPRAQPAHTLAEPVPKDVPAQSPVETARSLARRKLREQLDRAGLSTHHVRSARLRLERLSSANELVEGEPRQGFHVRCAVTVTADTGRVFAAEEVVFVAPHDPALERRSARPKPELRLRHLADAADALPTLARWFEREWAPYYGPEGPGDATTDLTLSANRDVLPLCLVAFLDGELAGTISLKTESFSHPELGPWGAALLVAPRFRRRGVASFLIAALEAEARRLGFAKLYMATDSANALVERRGWRAIDQVDSLRGLITLYELEL